MTNLSDLFPAPTGGTTNVPSTITYTPAMMKYNGSSDYVITSTQTFSSQTETTVFRVKMPSFTGNSSQRVWNVRSTSDIRTTIRAYSSDYSADTALQNRFTFEVRSSGNTVICKICTNIDIADGEQKNILFAFNGTSGASTLTINGIDADDTGWANRVAPTTGTPASASMQVGLGDDPVGSGNEYVGEMGFFGWSLSYLTNYSDFFDSNGNPIKQDTTTWANSGWGSQPLFWNEAGEMSNNLGSAGNMTKNGTITVADEPIAPPVMNYQPAMMQYNGSSYYQLSSVTTSGNKLTVVAKFKLASFTGTSATRRVYNVSNSSAQRVNFAIFSSNHSTTENQNKLRVFCQNSAGSALLVDLLSNVTVTDNKEHTLFFSFDGDTGSATFLLDGLNADDTGYSIRTAPTAGTLPTSTIRHSVGCEYTGGSIFLGTLGFIGYDEQYLTNYSDFFDSNGYPIKQDETTWANSGWGSQPLFWNEHGDMANNKGSAGSMTKSGTIVVADQGSTFYGRLTKTYSPNRVVFNGTQRIYKTGVTVSGNLLTMVCAIKRSSFTGGGQECFMRATDNTVSRGALFVHSSDYSTAGRRNKVMFFVQNSGGSTLCRLFSSIDVTDGDLHYILAAYNGDNGTAVLYVDGVEVTDTGNAEHSAPTTGTPVNSGVNLVLGNATTASQFLPFQGEVGYAGYSTSYLTNASDFQGGRLDESTWTEWGAQPLLWNEHGLPTDNKGSAGDFTTIGTIRISPEP